MANVSKPVSLFSPTDYAVIGLESEKKPAPPSQPKKDIGGKRSPTKPKKPISKKKKTTGKKKPTKKKTAAKVNKAKLLPWM